MRVTVKKSIKFLMVIVAVFLFALGIAAYYISAWVTLIPLAALFIWLNYTKKIFMEVRVEVDSVKLIISAPIITTSAGLNSFTINFTSYEIRLGDISKASLNTDSNAYGSGLWRTVGKGVLAASIVDNNGFKHQFNLDVFNQDDVKSLFRKLPNSEILI